MVNHPKWSEKACIYEVNIRQFSKEGNFSAFRKHLPRIKEIGITILWFMPIHPIGKEKRQGALGSYYAVKDFQAINEEFGTLEEFKELVKEIHNMGMYVLIDWVANHTAWDNELTSTHPEWYHRDNNGQIKAPFEWHDVAHLNYSSPQLRRYMIDSMLFWIKETDIDGFRCDVADLVPTDFWNEARQELDAAKHVFMLAEAEQPELNIKAFDMSYASKFHKLMKEVAKGKKKAYELINYFTYAEKSFPENTYLMQFTSNHDENSWNGTEHESFGNFAKLCAVLSFMVPGMPLIYSGQEALLNKRLLFFDKDCIEWKNTERADFYKQLIEIKNENIPLWNGNAGSSITWINTTNDDNLFAFMRIRGFNSILCVFNFSEHSQSFKFKDIRVSGNYSEIFSNEKKGIHPNRSFTIEACGYLIYKRI